MAQVTRSISMTTTQRDNILKAELHYILVFLFPRPYSTLERQRAKGIVCF